MYFKSRLYFYWLFFSLLALATLAACGGGGGGAGSSSTTVTSGVAADPYIVGAVFQEVAPSGAVLQESTPSDEEGRFQFQHTLTLGSIIQMKPTDRGMHNNVPFKGNLRRIVDDDNSLVVTPLTTLLANGLTDDEVISLLTDAGLPGLNRYHLYEDPMHGLNERHTVTDDDLLNLQSAIAVNQFFIVNGDYDMPREQILQNRARLAEIVALVKEALNAEVLEKSLEDIQDDMNDANVSPTMRDAISASVNIIDESVNNHMADPYRYNLSAGPNYMYRHDDLALHYSVQNHRGEPSVEAEISRGNLPDIDSFEHPDIDELNQQYNDDSDDDSDNGGSNDDDNPVIPDAGVDQTVEVGSRVYLSASQYRYSYSGNDHDGDDDDDSDDDSDNDGDDDDDDDDDSGYELNYFWSFRSKPAGSRAVFSNNRFMSPWFTADLPGIYEVVLTIYYDDHGSMQDTVTVLATSGNNIPPNANAGQNQHVTTGTTVKLNGSASSDADRDPLTYSWSIESRPVGSSATLSSPSAEQPTFFTDRDGTYILSLTVNDGVVDSSPDTITVTAASGNTAPVANAGPDQSVPVSSTVTLNGSASNDPDNDPLNYSWTITSKPTGSNATLSNSGAVNPNFVADLVGTYVISLTVNDGTNNSNSDTVRITAASGNVPPVARAGANQNVPVNATVTLDGSASSDGDNDPLTYSWSITSKPAGSTASLSSSTSVNPSFVADLPGTYNVMLIVNDGSINSAADSANIMAASNNVPPTSNAGPNQNVFVFDLVTLNGSASSDAENDPLTYSWTITSKPAGSSATLSSNNVSNPSFVADFEGSYTVRLIVNDGTSDSAPDTVTVTASSSNVAPTADGGVDQNVTAGDTVNLDGSGSSDPDNDPLSYSWTFTSRPAGSTAAFSNSSSVSPNFVADQPGSYVIRLLVNDGTIDSAPDTMTVTAAQPPASCTTCHGFPPAVGGHAVHSSLPDVGTNCATCHANNSHMSGSVDVNLSATYDARSGTASWGGNTCSTVSCHGGQTTPAWLTGSLNVNSQCTSCHSSGTAQYNSYNSGRHTMHLNFGFSCTACHNTATLAQNHFTNLNTTTMEGPASATIGGGSTSVTSYSAGPQTCVATCHESKSW